MIGLGNAFLNLPKLVDLLVTKIVSRDLCSFEFDGHTILRLGNIAEQRIHITGLTISPGKRLTHFEEHGAP